MNAAEGLASLKAENKKLRAVLEAYEKWEADLIMDDEAWDVGMAELPKLTYPLYEEMMRIQAMRNVALGR